MTENQIIHEMFCLGMTIPEIAEAKEMYPCRVRNVIAAEESKERKKWERMREVWYDACGELRKVAFVQEWNGVVLRLRRKEKQGNRTGEKED